MTRWTYFALSVLALGCVAPPIDTDAAMGDAFVGTDGSSRDAGHDAPSDAGSDASTFDAGTDASVMLDAGADAACSTDLSTDVHHCGACDVDCTTLPNVDASGVSCAASHCVLACAAGHADCTADPGCETDVTTPAHCGACAVACVEPAPLCSMGASGYACASGCSGATPTRCGTMCVDTNSDPAYCGSCTNACTAPTGGSATCASATCGAMCAVGDHLCGSACVHASDPMTCGTSCTPCAAPTGGSATCDGISCGTACPSGTHLCGSACLTNTSPASCGASCTACVAPTGGSATCDGTSCGTACPSGTHLCGSACVSNTSVSSCGASCSACTVPSGGSATCDGTTCGTSCPSGTNFCSGACVSSTSTSACGPTCHFCSTPANAMPTCDGTSCGFSCYTGYHLCGTQCQPTNAGNACGPSCTVCPIPTNGVSTCDGTNCGFACNAGYAPSGTTCSPVPRPLAPISTGLVTTRRPTFRWVAASGITDATIDLCATRACTSMISSTHVTGTSFTPSADLPIGVVFWRLHPGTTTTLAGPTWSFTVGVRSAAIDTSWGSTLDVNGDGYSDLIVGDGGVSNTPPETVRLYLGSASGLSTTVAWSITDAGGTGLGTAVASAGDVNGDGFADVIVGMPRGGHGSAQVFFGSATGLATTASWNSATPSAASAFGYAVTGVGDVNGDGYADIAIGAPYSNSNAGALYFWYGGANGPNTNPIPDRAYTGFGGGFAWNLGQSIASGDANGDGYTDVFAGIPAASGGGGVYAYYGSATGLPAGGTLIPAATVASGASFGAAVACADDVNGDGYADLLVGEPMLTTATGQAHLYLGSASGIPGSPVWTQNGAAVRVAFGEAVASAGDVNADGYSDVIVGAPADTSTGGAAFVYLGGSGGLSTTVAWTQSGSTGAVQRFGGAVAGIGDVTHDGRADIAIGVPGEFPGGRVNVYPGIAAGVSTTAIWTITGTPNTNYGSAL